MANSTGETFQDQRQLFGHPVGLYVLFFTELWERFSYYGMRALLTLYMVTQVTGDNPGLGWDTAFALSIYGWYTMLVYVAGIPGGILADKYIGQKKSVMVGGFLLVAGHTVLAIDQIWAFYTGLALIISGVGCLKPNISTMVGGLYRQGDVRRDQGFTIFYIGINIGAFLSALIVGFIGETYGWHYGFGLAGIGMLIGQIVFIAGQKYLKGIGESPSIIAAQSTDGQQSTSLGVLFQQLLKSPTQLIITGVLAALGVGLSLSFTEGYNRIAYSLLGVFLAVVIGLLMMIYKEVNKTEKDRFLVLLISFLIVIVFWGAFEQAGGLMNIYTLEKIDREVSLLSLNLLFYGAGAFLTLRGIWHAAKKKQTAYIYLPIGILLIAFYILLRQGQITSNPYEIPAAVFQSVNALFIIIFGTLVGGFWIWWHRQNRESSSLFKMALGTIIMGVGFLFMAKASADVVQYGDRAALFLLIMAYLLHTIGELCASPVALSFITKLAPVKYVSVMMGVYFAATGLGNKIAGTVGELAQTEPIKMEIAEGANYPAIEGLIREASKSKDDRTEEGYPRNFKILGDAYLENGSVIMQKDSRNLFSIIDINQENRELLNQQLASEEHSPQEPLTAVLSLEKEPGQEQYAGEIQVFEAQDNREFWTFVSIFLFTSAFGLLLILFLKPLKRLTHGAEDIEDTHHEEQEPYELADRSESEG